MENRISSPKEIRHTRKMLLKQANDLMKQEKREERARIRATKFKFNLKKYFTLSLFIVLAFLMTLSFLVPITNSTAVDQDVKIAVWAVFSGLFVVFYVGYFIYMFMRERKDFYLKDSDYVNLAQAKDRYKKEIKLAKLNCKLKNIKFTRKMREDIKLACYTIYMNNEDFKKEKETPLIGQYIRLDDLIKEKKLKKIKKQSKNIIGAKDSLTIQDINEDDKSYIRTSSARGVKQIRIIQDPKTNLPAIEIFESDPTEITNPIMVEGADVNYQKQDGINSKEN